LINIYYTKKAKILKFSKLKTEKLYKLFLFKNYCGFSYNFKRKGSET